MKGEGVQAVQPSGEVGAAAEAAGVVQQGLPAQLPLLHGAIAAAAGEEMLGQDLEQGLMLIPPSPLPDLPVSEERLTVGAMTEQLENPWGMVQQLEQRLQQQEVALQRKEQQLQVQKEAMQKLEAELVALRAQLQ